MSLAAPSTSVRAARIGCAGWSIPAAHRHWFGAGDSTLASYATRFNTTEINSSFYRPHQQKTYARWADSVPDDFLFSVKVPKLITHELGLRNAGSALDGFLDEVAGLGRKLGGLLLQLPPSLTYDAHLASIVFAMLRRRTLARIVVEPRHASWFSAGAEAQFVRHAVARAGVDPAVVPDAATPGQAGAWRYWRWHGSPRAYYSQYGADRLAELAKDVQQASQPRVESWIIFDNTASGCATADAMMMQSLMASDTDERAIQSAA